MDNKWRTAIKAMSPAPSQPGMGAGGIPGAKGLMQGSQNRMSLTDLIGNIGFGQQKDNARQQMSNAMMSPDGSMPPAQPANQMPMQWTPQVQQQVMQYLMGVFQQTKPGDRMTTTGGVIARPRRGY